jgi:DNA-directed RNA polymerase alpha subunit
LGDAQLNRGEKDLILVYQEMGLRGKRLAKPIALNLDEILLTPLGSAGFATRTLNNLERKNIRTVGDLASCTRQQLESISQISTVTIDECAAKLESMGVKNHYLSS